MVTQQCTHFSYFSFKSLVEQGFIEGSLSPFVVYNVASLKTSLPRASLVMARRSHSFSLGVSLKSCWEFLVSSNTGEIHKDSAVFPSPLKICRGFAPNCSQCSVSLRSVPVQMGSSRKREAAVHTRFCFRSWSTLVLSKSSVQASCLLYLPSRFLQREEAKLLSVKQTLLWCWSGVEGANPQPFFGCAAVYIFLCRIKHAVEVQWAVSKLVVTAVAVPADLH